MAPPTETFPTSRLEQHLQYKPNGKLRKPPVDLKNCPLKELIQYECELDGPKDHPRSKVICTPVLRLFRQCADGLTVEVTSLEGIHDNGATK